MTSQSGITYPLPGDRKQSGSSSISQSVQPIDEADVPYHRAEVASGKKRKGQGPTQDEDDGQDDHLEEQTVDREESRIDKRRNQNKLAQRAFRARTKIQHGEVSL